MDRDHKVDGTFGSNMFRPSHTRRPMDNWSGLKDCQILELMANGKFVSCQIADLRQLYI